jgi:hypothetical protein
VTYVLLKTLEVSIFRSRRDTITLVIFDTVALVCILTCDLVYDLYMRSVFGMLSCCWILGADHTTGDEELGLTDEGKEYCDSDTIVW